MKVYRVRFCLCKTFDTVPAHYIEEYMTRPVELGQTRWVFWSHPSIGETPTSVPKLIRIVDNQAEPPISGYYQAAILEENAGGGAQQLKNVPAARSNRNNFKPPASPSPSTTVKDTRTKTQRGRDTHSSGMQVLFGDSEEMERLRMENAVLKRKLEQSDCALIETRQQLSTVLDTNKRLSEGLLESKQAQISLMQQGFCSTPYQAGNHAKRLKNFRVCKELDFEGVPCSPVEDINVQVFDVMKDGTLLTASGSKLINSSQDNFFQSTENQGMFSADVEEQIEEDETEIDKGIQQNTNHFEDSKTSEPERTTGRCQLSEEEFETLNRKAGVGSGKDLQFIRDAMEILWTEEEMLQRSALGNARRDDSTAAPKQACTPEKVEKLKECLIKRGEFENPQAEGNVHQLRSKDIVKYINEKLKSVRTRRKLREKAEAAKAAKALAKAAEKTN